jgi:hypothetical protein
MTFMNILDGVPAQTGQFCYFLDISNPAKLNSKSFKRPCVVLLRISKTKMRLFYSTAFLALKPGDFNGELNLCFADRQSFKCACNLAKMNDIARFTVRTL